jgi:cell division protein FtsZ
MSTDSTPEEKKVRVKVIAVGDAGTHAVECLRAGGLADAAFAFVNTEPKGLKRITNAEKLCLGSRLTRGLGVGGDPEMARAAADEGLEELQKICADQDLIFLVTGLGGGTGTGVSPVLAKVAKESGAKVLAFALMPLLVEGSRRAMQAQVGAQKLKMVADGVICLPNEAALRQVAADVPASDAFAVADQAMAELARCVCRLLIQPGVINVSFADLCALLRGRETESHFASAEAAGDNYAEKAARAVVASKGLDEGRALERADTVLVSLVGGSDLSMQRVQEVVQHINCRCPDAQMVMGTALDKSYHNRLSICILASRREEASEDPSGAATESGSDQGNPRMSRSAIENAVRLNESTTRPVSRFVAPAPSLTPEKRAQLLARQAPAPSGSKKAVSRPRQGQLPLDIISKGRFEKSEPTIRDGEDLDVPTYIRRGVPLN